MIGEETVSASAGNATLENAKVGEAPMAGVFLLDPDGPAALDPLGWRGQELSMRPLTCEPWAVARELSEQFRMTLEVHSIFQMNQRLWIILRRSSRYSLVTR